MSEDVASAVDNMTNDERMQLATTLAEKILSEYDKGLGSVRPSRRLARIAAQLEMLEDKAIDVADPDFIKLVRRIGVTMLYTVSEIGKELADRVAALEENTESEPEET